MCECHRQNPLMKCHFSNYHLQRSKCREGDENCKSVWVYVLIKILIKHPAIFSDPCCQMGGEGESLDVNMGKEFYNSCRLQKGTGCLLLKDYIPKMLGCCIPGCTWCRSPAPGLEPGLSVSVPGHNSTDPSCCALSPPAFIIPPVLFCYCDTA